MPPNYRQQQGKPLAPHERRGGIVLGLATLACVVGVSAWGLTGGFGSSHPQHCVSVMVAGSTGGGQARSCGGQARSWCRTESTAADAFGARAVLACRKAGFLPD